MKLKNACDPYRIWSSIYISKISENTEILTFGLEKYWPWKHTLWIYGYNLKTSLSTLAIS